MPDALQSEPFLTYMTAVVGTIFFGSHVIIYLLSILGPLLKPFWRRPVAFLYPWVYLTAANPQRIAETPFKPSRLLIIHALWLFNSVGFYVGFALYLLIGVLISLFVYVFDPNTFDSYETEMSDWIIFAIVIVFAGVFALCSSWMWLRSLRRSLAHYRRMNDAGDDRSLDDPGHYLAPFRKTAAWALVTIPVLIGYTALGLATWEPG